MQGAVQPHQAKFKALGVEAITVRTEEEMRRCAGMILPGGESTTMLKLLQEYGLWEPLRWFGQQKPLWGICAGSILMAARVENPTQDSLGLVPMTVLRNAYGRQNESFITTVDLRLPGAPVQRQEAVFIRAPRIQDPGPGAEVLASHEGDPVVVRHGRHLITTFHPELTAEARLHSYFAALCMQEGGGLIRSTEKTASSH